VAKSPNENAPGSEILRYDLGWKAINDLLRSGRSLSGHERNCCFLNLGASGSSRFADISAAVDADLDDDGRVLALADWDYDGDPDMWIANRSGPQLRYLRNDLTSGRNFIAIRMSGTTSNRDAIGARVTVVSGDGTSQIQTVHAGQGYLSQSSRWLHFGLGNQDTVKKVSVRWPGGAAEEFAGIAVNNWNQLTQDSGHANLWQPPAFDSLPSAAVNAPRVGDSARVLLLQPLPLPELDGLTKEVRHARLVSLWADWCAPCLSELKKWAVDAEEFSTANVEIVALNVSDTEDLKKWRALDVPFTCRFGSRELVEKFDVLQRSLLARQRPLPLPSSFLIDPQGRLRAIYKGTVSAQQILKDASLIDKDRAETLAAAMPLPGRWHAPPGGSSPSGLAIQFIEGGYTSQAEAYLDSLAAQPLYRTASVYNLLGALRIDRREFSKAADAFTRALQLDTDNRQAHIELGGLLLGINKGAEAEKHFTAVLTANPNDPELIQKLGIAQMQQNRLAESRESMRKAIKLNPTPVAYRYLLKVELALENSAGAILVYEKGTEDFVNFVPSDATADLAAVAAVYAATERFAEAVAILSRATNRTEEMDSQLEQYRRNQGSP
jgi:tetratricopeptide (TPR) repeat protein